MIFDVITIFPKIFDCFKNESLLKRAQEEGIIKINIHNLRNWAVGKHKIVDDKPYGGGPGMILKIEPIYKAVSEIISNNKRGKTKIIFLSPRGNKFTQTIAKNWAKRLERIIIISGRYEGVDERVKKIADDTISIGDFITLGGEVPAMIIIETVSRLIKGVVGKKASVEKIDFPQYTRPEIFSPKTGIIWRVPKILLSGDHRKIDEWRKRHGKEIK